MKYQEVLDYLYAQLPMFQRIGKSAFKKNLTNTIALCNLLDNPHKKFTSIHIAGTNGKGSVSHLLASALQENGYKTGLYTSPHLKDFRERIKINGEIISENTVIDFVNKFKCEFEKIKPSFFEWTVALAFYHFNNQKVDIAIIETGMGGRLDSTNVINPLISVITNIGYDHTEFLGDTLEKIAGEKAGIIKLNTPIVVGRKQNETTQVFEQKAKELKASLYFAQDLESPTLKTDLQGGYQKENLQTAFAALKIIQPEFNIDLDTALAGFTKVYANTNFSGRWQTIDNNPKTICDVGHNEEGIKWVLENLKSEKFENLHFVFGMVSDKEHDKILNLLPKNAQYYFCKPNVPRGLDAEILISKAQIFNLQGNVYKSVKSALKAAQTNAMQNDLVLVGGSTFVVAEAL